MKWIKVSERLPSKDECNKFDIGHPSHRRFSCTINMPGYNSFVVELFFSKVFGWKYGAEDYNGYVIAWQPLPAPLYEGEIIMEHNDYCIIDGTGNGEGEFLIYNNGEYICSALDREIAEGIIQALEKQVLRKVTRDKPWDPDLCPNCCTNKLGAGYVNSRSGKSYCQECGQLFYWD